MKQIKKRMIGLTNISVNPIGLGTMPLSIQGRPDESNAIKVICAALEAGIDFIDTANVYCLDHRDIGHSERLIAKALKEWGGKTKVIVATKGGLMRPNGAWVTNGHPQQLKAACEASLNALEVNCVDLYQLHAPDDAVPFVESIGALAELKQAGKIKHIGLSNVALKEIKKAREIVEIVSIQNRCSPFDLSPFRNGVLAYCEQEKLSFLPYSPMGGSSQKHLIANHPILCKIAEKYAMDPYQVTLAWLLAKSPMMFPIPGASRVESAISSARAMKLSLQHEEITALDVGFGLA